MGFAEDATMAMASICKVCYPVQHFVQLDKRKFIVHCCDKPTNGISIKNNKVNIAFPLLDQALVKDTKLREAKFDLRARLNITLDVSFVSKVQSDMRRRSFSALLIFTAVCLMGPAALAASEPCDIPEYGPELPRKDIVFQGSVFLAKVMRPEQPRALSDARSVAEAYDLHSKLLKNATEVDDGKIEIDNDDESEEELEEVLELSLEVPRSLVTGFDVFINLPSASESTSITLPEYVGSYINEVGNKPGYRRTKIRFGISDKIKMLKLEKEASVIVAVVRHGSTKDVPVTIKDIDIALE